MGLTKNLGWLSKYITADSAGTGLIGIGASSGLVEKLTLDGNMLIKSAGAVKFNRTDNAISTDLYDAGTYFALNNRNGNGFDFQSAGTSQVKISASGNLGVGVPSPNFRLDVSSGTTGTIAAFNSTRVGGGGITLMNNSAARAYIGNANWVGISGEGTSSTAIAITSAENSAIIFGTNAAYAVSDKMRILPNGNVLINTTTDNGNKLQVNGTITATNIDAGQYVYKDSSGTSFITYYNNLPSNSSKSFLLYNAPDSPTAGGMWTVTMVKWFADYGSMMAINCEPGTQNMYVKTVYGGSWSGWVQK